MKLCFAVAAMHREVRSGGTQTGEPVPATINNQSASRIDKIASIQLASGHLNLCAYYSLHNS
jgi:hypothetical protein